MLLHRQPTLWNPRFVPTGAVEIDWNHPLASDLVACYVPGNDYDGTDLSDLSGIGPDLNIDTNGVVSITPEGFGYSCVELSAAAYSTGGTFPSEWLFPNGGTMYWRGSAVASPTFGSGWWPVLFGITYGGTTSDGINGPLYGLALAVYTTPTGDRPAFLYTPAGKTSPSNIQLASTWDTLMVGAGPVAMGVTFVPGGGLNLYVWPPAGTAPSITTFTWSGGAIDNTQPWQLSIGSTQTMDSSDTTNTVTTSAYMWDRVLSPAEMSVVNSAPFSFLRPTSRVQRAPNLPPGGPFRRWNRTYLIR